MKHRGTEAQSARSDRDSVSVDYPPNSFPENWSIEIDYQTNMQVGKAEIGEQLYPVNLIESLHRFQLNENRVVDEQVGAKGITNSYPLVLESQRNLRPVAEASELQLPAMALVIG